MFAVYLGEIGRPEVCCFVRVGVYINGNFGLGGSEDGCGAEHGWRYGVVWDRGVVWRS